MIEGNSMSKKKKIKNTYICEFCGNEHDGSYGSSRFCSTSCASKYSNQYITKESKNKLRDGKLGELATIKKFAEHDIPVYLPVSDNGIDMIAEFGGKLQKIQVKSSTQSTENSVSFSLTHNKNIIKGKTVKTEHRKYSSEEIDYFSLYDIPNDEVFLLKNNRNSGAINIRYKKSKNNQSLKINKAEDYQIDKILDEIELGIDPDNIIDADYEILDDE